MPNVHRGVSFFSSFSVFVDARPSVICSVWAQAKTKIDLNIHSSISVIWRASMSNGNRRIGVIPVLAAATPRFACKSWIVCTMPLGRDRPAVAHPFKWNLFVSFYATCACSSKFDSIYYSWRLWWRRWWWQWQWSLVTLNITTFIVEVACHFLFVTQPYINFGDYH